MYTEEQIAQIKHNIDDDESKIAAQLPPNMSFRQFFDTLPEESKHKLFIESNVIDELTAKIAKNAKEGTFNKTRFSGHPYDNKIHYHINFLKNNGRQYKPDRFLPLQKIQDIKVKISDMNSELTDFILCILKTPIDIIRLKKLIQGTTLANYIIAHPGIEMIELIDDKYLIEYPEIGFHDETQFTNPLLLFSRQEYAEYNEEKTRLLNIQINDNNKTTGKFTGIVNEEPTAAIVTDAPNAAIVTDVPNAAIVKQTPGKATHNLVGRKPNPPWRYGGNKSMKSRKQKKSRKSRKSRKPKKSRKQRN